LAKNIRCLHGRARQWNGNKTLNDAALVSLVKEINSKRTLGRLRVRELCIELVAALEGAHANA